MGKRKVRSNDDLVVAGVGAEGHGVITGCRGNGPLTRERFVELLQRSGIEEAWFPPAKDAKVQLTRAMRSVASKHGMSAEVMRKKDRQTVEVRDWSGCLCMVHSNTPDVMRAGEAFGSIVFVATLFDDAQGQELTFDEPEHALAIEVRAEYERLTGAELYQAADITGHLNHLYRDLLGGVRLGAGWYIPRAHKSIAEQIADIFWGEARWGEAWFYPPLPVATSEQLHRGIANGLCEEVDEQLALIDKRRRRLRETNGGFDKNKRAVPGGAYNADGELVDIGAQAAETFAVRFARVGHRVHAYASQIGADLVTECMARIGDAMIELDHILEGGSTKAGGGFRDLIVEAEERDANERAKLVPEQSFADVAKAVRA